MFIAYTVKFSLFRRRNKFRFQLSKRQNNKTVISKWVFIEHSGRLAQVGGKWILDKSGMIMYFVIINFNIKTV